MENYQKAGENYEKALEFFYQYTKKWNFKKDHVTINRLLFKKNNMVLYLLKI